MVGFAPSNMAKTASLVKEKTKKPVSASAVTPSGMSLAGYNMGTGPKSLDASRDAWANALDQMGSVYTPDPITAVAKVAGMGLAGYGQSKAIKAKEEGSAAYKAKLADVLAGKTADNTALMGMMADPYADEGSQKMLWEMWNRNNPTQDELLRRQMLEQQMQQGQQQMDIARSQQEQQAAEFAQQQAELQRQNAIRGGKMDAVEGFLQNQQAQGGDLFSPEMQAQLRAMGVEGADPQDTRRYDAMQPYAAAGDYENAFAQMAAQPATDANAPVVKSFKTTDKDGNPVELTVQWDSQQGWVPIGQAPVQQSGINVDARQMGNIPPGYTVEYDEQNRPVRMVPIPGGPAAAEATKANSNAEAQQNKRMTMTDTITGAADAARALANGTGNTGLIGQGMSYFGQSDAAEIYRQVEVMKSAASIENLNAMRRESPTGGALGAVSDKENAMLAAAAGALDPASGSERFQQQLDNYELTLMRVIHGYDAGTQMFEQRKAAQAGQATQQPAPAQGSGEEWTIDENGNPKRVR